MKTDDTIWADLRDLDWIDWLIVLTVGSGIVAVVRCLVIVFLAWGQS